MKQALYTLEPDHYFILNGEMIEGCGEDSYYAGCTDYTAVSAVFDGCGGIGSRKYERYSGHSGAYMSARAVSGAMYDWFHDYDGGASLDSQEIGTTMKTRFQEAVRILQKIGSAPSRLTGTLVRDFPSTAALALVRRTSNDAQEVEVHCLWAGDSRVYLLDRKGMAQLTSDDIADRDAMHNLRADGALTNMVAADGTFALHHRVLQVQEPVVLLTATDGCFGYLPTPMDFENLILSSLQGADSPQDFEDALRQAILEVTGDDYTLGFMCFGYASFADLKKQLKRRSTEVEKKYIRPMLDDGSEELAEKLWESYRDNYLRYMKK